MLFLGQKISGGNGFHGPPAGVKLHRQGHKLKDQGQTEAGNSGVDQYIGEISQIGQKKPDEDQGHCQPGAQIGHGNYGGPELDGCIALGVLHGMSCLVAGNTDGGGGGVVIYVVGQADHIGFRVVVVREVSGDPLDLYTLDAVCHKHPLGSLGAGNPPGGQLTGIFFKGAVNIGAGPHGKNDTGQHKDQIGPVKTVIIGHSLTPFHINPENPLFVIPRAPWLCAGEG